MIKGRKEKICPKEVWRVTNFFDRSVLAIVMYGHNVSGLDLDPEEREHLVRVVAHASIALSSIELARFRSGGTFELPVVSGVRAV